MKRRRFLGLVGCAAAAWPVAASAQPERPKKIGWLKIQDQNHTPSQLGEFIGGLRSLGFEEGKHFVIEYRFADGDSSRLVTLAAELVQAKVDVILATSQPAVDAARRATATIPIVGRMTDDPVSSGIAVSLSRPEGNVTGVYSLLEEMSGKRLALLKQTAPAVRRVGALLTLNRGATAHWLAEAQKAARELSLDIHTMDVRAASELDGVFAKAAEQRVDGLIAFRNPTVVTHDRRVIDLTYRYRMPSIFDAREFVVAGALMSYGPNLDTIFRRLAAYVDNLFRGARPGKLPIEQPSEFELVVNITSAKMLGIAVPDTVLAIANRVIE